ncbi:MAG: FAD-dependent oxidoreductase [Candidatus Competibacter sp.]|nr:FAD-dependent oxidoreductase [Candidatus Competibacter sp.]MDG4583730.1 FAD-dependent oxidoreductase [Candidatus Competibacter sp.]
MADRDLLIIGAGISGLSMAHYAAAAGLNALVLEREDRVGGCLHSHRFGEPNGFWLELGAHSGFNSYGNLLAILERVGLLDRLQRRAKVGFRMFAGGAVKSIPSQLHFPALALAPFRMLGLIKTGRTVADYYGHIVGRRNYTAVFEPAFNAVICQPAGEFPADSLFQPRPRRKDAPRSFTLPGGLQTIADTLAGPTGIPVELGRNAREIRRDGEGFVVRTDRGEYSARALCLATPVAAATELLRVPFPDIAGRLAEIETARVESVGIALPAARLPLPPVAGLIGRDESFYSAVSRDTVPDAHWRGFTFHFRPGVLGEEEKVERIAQVLGIDRALLESGHMAFKLNQLPVLRVGHSERAEVLNPALAGNRLALIGNYFSGVAIEDCVTRSRAEFERLRREGL